MPNTVVDTTQWLHVVAAVIRDAQQQRILVAQRPLHKHQGGKWEFPGGKVEVGESAPIALRRELHEELGIQADPAAMRPFLELRYPYPEQAVWLDVWEVGRFTGEARGQEGQLVQWVTLDELQTLEFPAANLPILQALRAPLSQ